MTATKRRRSRAGYRWTPPKREHELDYLDLLKPFVGEPTPPPPIRFEVRTGRGDVLFRAAFIEDALHWRNRNGGRRVLRLAERNLSEALMASIAREETASSEDESEAP